MRILGIDYGDSRIGVAVSDQLEITANGLETINSGGNINIAVSKIIEICNNYEIKTIIVGYPKNMNGTLGERTAITDKFIDMLQKKLPGMKIIKWDERLSSAEAHKIMRETGLKTRKKGKGIVDKIAAEIILQGYLNSIS